MQEPRILLLLIVALGCQIQSSGSWRILAIFPLNSRSHDAMFSRLTAGLAAKGHQLDVYSQYPPKKPMANYQHHSLAGTLRTLVNSMNYSMAVQLQAQNPRDVLDAMGTPSCELMKLPAFRKLIQDPPSYDLVIVEAFVADCYLAWGRHLDVPMVGVMTTPMIDWYNEALGNPFNRAVTLSFGVTDFVPFNFWHRLYNTVYGSFANFMFTRAMSYQNKLIESYFGPGYPDIAELRRDVDLLIVNSHHSLDSIRAYTPAIIPVAGIHINDEDATPVPQDIQRWLDNSEHGCVYFTFGSMVKIESFPRPVLQALHRTFANIAPVRVLLKIANSKELPASLPPNVMIRSWFPQLPVLRHNNTKVFVTHGGLMSNQEAIYSGVPLVGIPLFGDQYYNVESNVRKGIATSVKLEAIDEQTLTAAIKDVLYKPSYRQNMETLSRMYNDRPMKPLDTAVYWVEYVARHGKKCLRSPLVDMPWWQTNLLDVYTFIAVVLFALYYLLKLSTKKICSLCCANRKSLSSKDDTKKKK